MARGSKPVVVLADGRRVEVSVGRKLHGYYIEIQQFDTAGRTVGSVTTFDDRLVDAVQEALHRYNVPSCIPWSTLEWH